MRPLTYFRTLFRSISTPKYYVDVLNAPFWFTARFVLLSYLMFSVGSGCIFAIVEVPKIAETLHSYVDTQISAFPETGKFTWNGLKLSSSFAEPYTLPFPEVPQASDMPKLLLTVDPEIVSESDISKRQTTSSFIIVGQNTAYVSQPNNTWSPLPLDELITSNEVTIDRAFLSKNTQKLHSLVNIGLRVLSLTFPVLFFLMTLLLRLIGTMLDTLLIYFCLKLVQLPMSLKKTFQINLHIMVVAELISLITISFRGDVQMFTIAFWIYSAVVYWQLRSVRLLPSV